MNARIKVEVGVNGSICDNIPSATVETPHWQSTSAAYRGQKWDILRNDGHLLTEHGTWSV